MFGVNAFFKSAIYDILDINIAADNYYTIIYNGILSGELSHTPSVCVVIQAFPFFVLVAGAAHSAFTADKAIPSHGDGNVVPTLQLSR